MRITVSVAISIAISLSALALVGARSPQSPAVWIPKPEPVTSPAGAGTSEPQLTVQGDRAILSWLETKEQHATLKFAEWMPTGWSTPHDVATGDDFFVNAADVPSVRALPDGTLVAHWLQTNGANPEGYDLRLSRSKDGGRTWSPLATPHHDKTETQHGFATLFPVAGGFGVVWLDGRGTNPEKETGDMALRATTYDANGRQGRETVVDNRVCDCCPTSAALTSEGVIVAFRDRSAAEVRDIYVTRLVNGQWNTPALVHRDNWRIEACPINGPAVSARERVVVVAWFNLQGDQGRASVAFSRDGGRTFGPAVRVDDAGSTGRVGVELLPDGSAAVSYVAVGQGGPQFVVRVIQPDGKRSSVVTIGGSGGLRIPRLAWIRDQLLFAWTEASGGGMRVQTARAVLTR